MVLKEQRDAEAEARARQKDARDDLKLSALRAESELTGDAPRIVNRKLQKKSQSADDLLGMALMEEACKAQRKRDKAAAAAAAAAQKSKSSASKSESNLAGLAKGMRRTGSSATLGARRGVRKVSSKSALFAMEANMEAIAIG
ncbi:BT1-like protein [Aureococcus anophagefferens]|nr:BT1-like protein [Aureococcus anophagefferens]